MTTPFFWLSLGTAAGILFSKIYPFSEHWVWTAFGISIPCLWFARGRRIFLPLLIFAWAALGYLYASAQNTRPDNAVENFGSGPESTEEASGRQRWITLKGLVNTQPEIKKTGRKVTVSFILSAKAVRRYEFSKSSFFKKGRIKENPVSGKVQVFMFQPQAIPDVGDQVELRGILKKPLPKLNPGNFDYGHYLAQNDIYCILNGYGRKSIRILAKSQSPFLIRWISGLRKNIAAIIDSHFPPYEAILFKALLLGMRKGIDPDLRSEYMKTGVSHLLAISGLHIGLVAGSIYFLSLVFSRKQKFAALTALIVTLIYIFIAGAGIPVRRAGWMCSAGFAAILLDRERNSLNIFFLAFLALILTDTRSFESVSFQLSFLSVFALILAGRMISRSWHWAECIMTSVSVLILTSPLVLFYFNVFSPIGIVANLLAIPLFYLALLTALCYLTLFYVPLLSDLFGAATLFFLRTGNLWIHYVSLFQWGYYFVSPPSIFHLLLYYILCGVCLAPFFFRFSIPKILHSILIIGWAAAAILFFTPKPKPVFEFTLFSAGKNEMAFCQIGDHSWLINAGRRFPSDQAEWILNSFLKWKGIRKLEGVFLADFYKKHTGGLQTLKRDFLIRNIWIPQKSKPVDLPRIPTTQVSSQGNYAVPDKIYTWANSRGQLSIEFLIPEHQIIFPSNLDSEIFEHLQNHKNLLPVEFLILPCQNFGFKDLERLLDLTGAQKVILPYASPALKDFLKKRGVRVWTTLNDGALTLRLKDFKSGMEIEPFVRGKA